MQLEILVIYKLQFYIKYIIINNVSFFIFVSLHHVWVAELKGDIIMAKLKLSGGSSSTNSVSFFLKNSDKGIEAVRQEDGTIVTKEVDSTEQLKTTMKLLKVIFIFSLFREFIFLLNLPQWLYHVPTFIWVGLFLIAILVMLANREMRMYHGAEHKVAHWYSKKNIGNNIESIKRCSRIHGYCGTNFLATIVTFQLASSICLNFFNFHIPEIITAILPFYVYSIFPFNLLGMLAQIITTASPTTEHISVAVQALSTLIKIESK